MIRYILSILLLVPASLELRAQNAADPQTIKEISITAKIKRGGDFMAFGFDSLWIMSGLRLARISPADNSFIDIDLDGTIGRYRGIQVGEGAIWVPDVGADVIYRVDPQTNSVALKIPAEMLASEGSIGVGAGSVWVVTDQEDHGVLTRFDAADGEVKAHIALPADGAGVEVAFGFVWVTAPLKDELYRIDPQTNSVTQEIALANQPRFLATDKDSVWVLNQGGIVQRIDGQTGELKATINSGLVGGGGDIATGGGFVWATSRAVPLIQIDPHNNLVVARYRGFGMGDAVRYGAGSVWISGGFVHRIGLPR
jgi:DNA-binding beta-propeller fold protein YncE